MSVTPEQLKAVQDVLQFRAFDPTTAKKVKEEIDYIFASVISVNESAHPLVKPTEKQMRLPFTDEEQTFFLFGDEE